MKKTFITIIVPVYNLDSYLYKCLESISNQSYKDWECIIINDKSTDNSEDIILNWCRKDSRFLYILNTTHLGVSKNRNIGIDHAKGEYVVFIDADDWIETDYLKDFITNLENKSTLLIQDIIKDYPNHSEIKTLNYQNDIISFPKDYKIFFTNHNYTRGYVSNKFFNISIIKDNNIFFFDEMFNEDEIFYMQYIQHIDKIIFLKQSNYHYLQRNNSRSRNIIFESYYNYIKQTLIHIDIIKTKILENNREYNLFFENYSQKHFTSLLLFCLRNGIFYNQHSFIERQKYLSLLRNILIDNIHLIHSNISFPQKIDLYLIKYNLLFLANLFLKFRTRFYE